MNESDAEAYVAAAVQYAEARVEYAQEWQRFYARHGVAQRATQEAIEATKDRATVAQAIMVAAEVRMRA